MRPRAVRRNGFIALLFAGCLAARTSGAAAPVPVEVVSHQGQWELAYGLVYYRVFGDLKNVSSEPVRFVKLRMTLLGAEGKPVLERVAYNQSAEALAEQETEGYEETLTFAEKLAKTKPLAPGQVELFRIGLAKEDIPASPRFVRYRLEILEAPGQEEEPGTVLAEPIRLEGEPADQGAPGGEGIDINAAGEEELMTLPDITKARARAILLHRKGNGPLIQLEELSIIPQISPFYEKIRDRLTLK